MLISPPPPPSNQSLVHPFSAFPAIQPSHLICLVSTYEPSHLIPCYSALSPHLPSHYLRNPLTSFPVIHPSHLICLVITYGTLSPHSLLFSLLTSSKQSLPMEPSHLIPCYSSLSFHLSRNYLRNPLTSFPAIQPSHLICLVITYGTFSPQFLLFSPLTSST